jgi:quercetin dioxygenase-like cupin family protein
MHKKLLLIFFLGILCSCENSPKKAKETKQTIENPTNKVVLSSEIVWEKLNPARGDKSPQAGTIWGDRKGTVATGFLAKFVDGFSSPPHIHNVTYRAVVIKGTIHNDDENAPNMWMQPGSFWTQPKGQSHITSAKGSENIAYVEIDHGPYLVKPVTAAFQTPEQPVNIDASNIVWLDENKIRWIQNSNAQVSYLWKHKDVQGLFIKLPKGFKGKLKSTGTIFHAVMIQGNANYAMPLTNEVKTLDAGSYFTATDTAIHDLSNESEEEVIIYIRTNSTIHIEE